MFGKFIESAYNYESSYFVFTKSRYDKIVRQSRFKSAVFHHYGALCRSRIKEISLNKPVMVGFSILCKSKLHMMKTYYKEILPAYISYVSDDLDDKLRLRVQYIDTDSIVLHLHLSPSQEMRFYNKLSHIFDFSDLPKTHKLYSTHNSSRIGVLKDESKGKVISKFLAACVKSYWVEYLDKSNLCKFKSVPRYVQDTQLTINDFFYGFNNPDKRKKLEYFLIRISESRELFTIKCKRKTLNVHDSKRYVIGRDSLALGHYLTLPRVEDL